MRFWACFARTGRGLTATGFLVGEGPTRDWAGWGSGRAKVVHGWCGPLSGSGRGEGSRVGLVRDSGLLTIGGLIYALGGNRRSASLARGTVVVAFEFRF
jgi:hypothetical protein